MAEAPIRLTQRYPTEPRQVLRQFIEPARFALWFRPIEGFHCGSSSMHLVPGGRFKLLESHEDGRLLQIFGYVESYDEAQQVSLRIDHVWHHDQEPDNRYDKLPLLTATVSGEGSECALVLEHSGFETDEERASVAACWDRMLPLLKKAIETDTENPFGNQASVEYAERMARGNATQSRFGGFWPDVPDAKLQIDGRIEVGQLSEQDRAIFEHWIDNGYVVLEGAADPALCDRLLDEVEAAWGNPPERLFIECDTEHGWDSVLMHERYRNQPFKILDMHSVSKTARAIQAAPATVRFLSQLMGRPPLGFQSLLFWFGTQQPFHQDTGFVPVVSPMEFVGSWVALEDIEEGTGELQYYVGSHRIPEFLYEGKTRAVPSTSPQVDRFTDWVARQSETMELRVKRFHPKKGDVLIWHADLVHGGSVVTKRGRTRKSLVTHYCPNDVDPCYMSTLRHSGRLEAGPGCYCSFPLRGE